MIESTPDNAQNLLDAFEEARLGTASLITPKEMLSNEITIFQDRVRIDVQVSTPGLVFADAWKNKKIMKYQNQEFYIVSKEDLIASKKAAGREVDLEDVKLLQLPDKEG